MTNRGCRALTDKEVNKIKSSFSGNYALRDRCLFILGLRTGLRITSLLSIKLGEVYQKGKVLDRVYIKREHVKRKKEGRSIPLHAEAKEAIRVWIEKIKQVYPDLASDPRTQLFLSEQGDHTAICSRQALRILKSAFESVGIEGKTGTHSMRKTFAAYVYNQPKNPHNIKLTQIALNHKSIEATAKYLSLDDAAVDAVFLGK